DANPECYAPDFDYLRLVRFAENLTVLAMAAYLTDRAEYGSHATRMLQRWFIAPATRQNPHFEFAQVAPQGAATPFEGRRPGLIESRFLVNVTEATRLLESSSLLP